MSDSGNQDPLWRRAASRVAAIRHISWRELSWKRVAVWFAWRAGLAAFFLAAVTALGIYIYTARAPQLAALWAVDRAPSYTILDTSGETLAIRGSFYGEDIKTKELPPHLVNAFLAIEDNRFYEHSGIDVWGLTRAMLANIQAGRWVQGGSTISQQLSKNLFLSNERTLSRKLTEMLHTIWLERHLTKDQILSLYLNRIYLGAGTYGVDAAAQFYFGKSAKEVTLAEAAMLASLPKAPSRYAPTADLNRATRRAELVLSNMTRFGFIKADQERQARNNPAKPITRPGTDNLGFFMDAVIQEIEETIGTPSSDIVVETTIDMNLQTAAEEAVTKIMDEKGEEAKAGEASFVAFSPDGSLRAMVGGRSYAQSQFNRATQAMRQPGSAFKPFVYLAAVEKGTSYRDPVFDEPVQVGDWTPENYGGHYRGRITVSEALQHSVNTVAVQLSETAGRENVIEAAHRLGIKSEIENHRAIALGTSETTLMELTSAYLPFANNGMTADPRMIARIKTKDGAVLYERDESAPERIIDQEVAQTMTHMLYQTVEQGTGRNANLGAHPVAGKTGTSQDYRDAWFIGYSGHYVAGAWVGNDDSSPMANITGASLPAQIWKAIMAPAHKDKKVVQLPGAFTEEPDPLDSQQKRLFLASLRVRLEAARDGERYDPRREEAILRRRQESELPRDGEREFERNDDVLRPVSTGTPPARPATDDNWQEMTHEERAEQARRWAERKKEKEDRSWWPF